MATAIVKLNFTVEIVNPSGDEYIDGVINEIVDGINAVLPHNQEVDLEIPDGLSYCSADGDTGVSVLLNFGISTGNMKSSDVAGAVAIAIANMANALPGMGYEVGAVNPVNPEECQDDQVDDFNPCEYPGVNHGTIAPEDPSLLNGFFDIMQTHGIADQPDDTQGDYIFQLPIEELHDVYLQFSNLVGATTDVSAPATENDRELMAMQIFCVFMTFIIPLFDELDSEVDCEAVYGYISIPEGSNIMAAMPAPEPPNEATYFGKTEVELIATTAEEFDCFTSSWGIVAPEDFIWPSQPITIEVMKDAITTYLVTTFPTGVIAEPNPDYMPN